MATTAFTGSPVGRRIIVREEPNVGLFLDLVCKFTGVKKGDMIRRIWSAGMRQVFDVTPDQLKETRLVIPEERRRQGNVNLRELAKCLCGETD